MFLFNNDKFIIQQIMGNISDFNHAIEHLDLDGLLLVKQMLDNRIKEEKTKIPRKQYKIEYEEYEVIVDRIERSFGYIVCYFTQKIKNHNGYSGARIPNNWKTNELPKSGDKILIRRRKVKNEKTQWTQPFKVIKII